jgi:hypothetical protein
MVSLSNHKVRRARALVLRQAQFDKLRMRTLGKGEPG